MARSQLDPRSRRCGGLLPRPIAGPLTGRSAREPQPLQTPLHQPHRAGVARLGRAAVAAADRWQERRVYAPLGSLPYSGTQTGVLSMPAATGRKVADRTSHSCTELHRSLIEAVETKSERAPIPEPNENEVTVKGAARSVPNGDPPSPMPSYSGSTAKLKFVVVWRLHGVGHELAIAEPTRRSEENEMAFALDGGPFDAHQGEP